MNSNRKLKELLEDFEFYKQNLINRKYMFIYSQMTNKQLSKVIKNPKIKNLKTFEIEFKASFFPHALGIKLYRISIPEFLKKLENKNLDEQSFEVEASRPLKRIALYKLPLLLKKSLEIGDYSGFKKVFKADKLLGSPSSSKDSTIGLLIGAISSKDNEYYIPNSLQYETTKNYIINGTEKKILFTLEKEKDQEKYNTILFKAKDIPIHNLYYNETIKQYLSIDLQEKIKKQITNYNCLTGEPINIEVHSSGENKWIGKKDVEKLEIEKKDDVKEKIAEITVMMTEKEMEDYKKNRGMETKEITNPSNEKKLYIIPVPYYNVSDLKITKEIEQKFVPMKEKEKSQEIEKSKGQGIGD